MITYAQIMRYFWLVTSFVIFIGVTYYGITEGFENWWYNYIFAVIALFAFILRSFMIRRMKKHMAYLNEKKSESQSTQH